MTASHTLATEDLTLGYGDRAVIEGLDLTLAAGRITVVVGAFFLLMLFQSIWTTYRTVEVIPYSQFLKLLDEFTAQGREVNHKGASTYAPAQFAKHPKAEGVTKSALMAAMNTLLGNGTIVIDEKGPASRRTSFLRRTVP